MTAKDTVEFKTGDIVQLYNGDTGQVLAMDIPNSHFFLMSHYPVDKFVAKSAVKEVVYAKED